MWTKTYWKRLATQVIAVTAGAAAGLVSVVLAGEVPYEDAAKALLGTALAVILKGLAAKRTGDPESPNFRS